MHSKMNTKTNLHVTPQNRHRQLFDQAAEKLLAAAEADQVVSVLVAEDEERGENRESDQRLQEVGEHNNQQIGPHLAVRAVGASTAPFPPMVLH
jgi:hypothetical protein